MNKRTGIFFLSCFIVITLFANQGYAATVAPLPDWASWSAEVSFPNNRPTASMTVEYGYTDSSGNQILMATETFPVSCWEVGIVPVSNGTAYFDGSSYLSCDMPNFQQTVFDLTNGQLMLADECVSKHVDAVANVNLLVGNFDNPLFYQSAIQFSAPVYNMTTGEVSMTTAGINAHSESHNLPSGFHQIAAAFTLPGSKTPYGVFFQLNNQYQTATPNQIYAEIKLPTTEESFFVGFNPDTNSYLHGELDSLRVDPGCFGRGGI